MTLEPLPAQLAAEINHEHSLALQHAGSALHHAFRAGELLVKSKSAIPHGRWLPWLREHIKFSDRTAQAYMRLTKRLPREMRNGAADLSVRKALAYVARPREDSMMEELRVVMEGVAGREAVNHANPEEKLKATVATIHDLSGWFHRHGLCSAFGGCTVCDAEAA